MEITNMILVTENWKGNETNSLMELMDYIDFMEEASWLSWKEVAEDMVMLGRTLGENDRWVESYIASNKMISARYCTDEKQLKIFLRGEFNTDQEWKFDEGRCSEECLDCLKALGISTDGRTGESVMRYEKLESDFAVGQILHNFNNNDYRVIECLSEKNLLLMDVNSGKFLVAVDTGKYRRSPKNTETTEKNSLIGIEWGHGHYLSASPSEIDFRRLKQEFGTPEKIRNQSDYRFHIRKQFNMLSILSEDRLATRNIRKAALKEMREIFGTDRTEVFMDNLESGKYDKGFTRKAKQTKER